MSVNKTQLYKKYKSNLDLKYYTLGNTLGF